MHEVIVGNDPRLREIRYDRVDVTDLIESDDGVPDRIVAYKAKASHLAPRPPDDAVILDTYARAVEEGFDRLGPGQLETYRATTGPYPVKTVDAALVLDRIPPGNPRAW